MNARGPPLIIASLPARSVLEARAQIEGAAAAGAQVAEIRFDLWNSRDRSAMAGLFPCALPLLATLRSKSEGGEGPDAPGPRQEWRTQVGELPFAWIDLESERDDVTPRAESPYSARQRTVASVHLPTTPSTAELRRRLVRGSVVGGIVKVVCPATVRSALHEVLPAIPSADEVAAVVHTTGPSGPLLRAWAKRLGLAGVYGSLPSADEGGVAPVESSQIPVDRLRRFFDAGGSGPIFAVVGHPVDHSLSPELHHRWMRRGDHAGLYIPLDIESEADFVDALEPLRAGGVRGLNVTHPLKETALAVATRVSPRATACGCANTLTFEGGEVEADNTDLVAVLRRLDELERAGRWDRRSMVVVGSGGAARAALAAARALVVDATILARDAVKAAKLATVFHATVGSSPPPVPSPLLVHATTVGRGPTSRLDVSLKEWIGAGTLCLDFVYRPENPSVEELVRGAGGQYEDGRRLLAYAAAASYERWWGSPVEPDWIDDALREPP